MSSTSCVYTTIVRALSPSQLSHTVYLVLLADYCRSAIRRGRTWQNLAVGRRSGAELGRSAKGTGGCGRRHAHMHTRDQPGIDLDTARNLEDTFAFEPPLTIQSNNSDDLLTGPEDISNAIEKFKDVDIDGLEILEGNVYNFDELARVEAGMVPKSMDEEFSAQKPPLFPAPRHTTDAKGAYMHSDQFMQRKLSRTLERLGKNLLMRISVKPAAASQQLVPLVMHLHICPSSSWDRFDAETGVSLAQAKRIRLIHQHPQYACISLRLLEVMNDLEQDHILRIANGVSVSMVRSVDEWDKLAKWIIVDDLFTRNARWLIQVAQLYRVCGEAGAVRTFREIVINVSHPLFKVTKDPQSHPELHIFLQGVVGFDSVDDKSNA
ncbi:hypothetical protein P692DRAFT_20869011 [Suillus brevipes Sb2]|nr:hypothetical protein P692DRAFT_20869011 [Suillus brevipes Sb2]